MTETVKQMGLFAAKSTYVFALVAFSILILGAVAYSTLTKVNEEVSYGYEKTYSAQGTAKKKVKLDTADVTLGVVLRDKTAAAVQKTAGERYEKVIAAIKSIGIPEEDIQTQGYNVSTIYNYETNDVDGYEINLSVVVTVKDTSPESELVSKVINAGAENGFNSVNNLTFYLQDMQAVQDQIKAEAIEDAKQRAKKEAELAGLKLGKLENMYTYNNTPYYDYAYGAPMMEANAVKDVAESNSLPTISIQPGQTEVTVDVTLEYEIL